MSTRKRFRELIARGRLVPMPGAYDALLEMTDARLRLEQISALLGG